MTSRLYTVPNLTPEQWQAIPVVSMPILKPAYSQAFVSVQILWDMHLRRYHQAYGGDPYIHIVKEHDLYWIHDGHHRYIFKLLRGEKIIWVRIVNHDPTPLPKEFA